MTSVTDEEILAAKKAIDRAGVGCEPASAASVAGIRRLVHEGVIQRGQRAVAILTGHVLKDPEILTRDLAGVVTEVDPTLEAMERAIGGS